MIRRSDTLLKSFFHSGFILQGVDQAVKFYPNVLGLL